MRVNIKSVEYFLSRKRHIFSLFVTIFCFAWMIMPMVVLRGDYCFVIHDGMDSYAGIVQFIHDNHLYFHLNQNLPIMNGLEGKYTFIGFTLYDFFNCMFGYVVGQILTRITGCFLGFFAFKHLVEYLYPERTSFFNDNLLLLSSLYIVIPVSPLRVIAFASLPLIVEFFLRLKDKKSFTKWCLVSVIFPVLSVFDGVFLFVLGFWFLFSVINSIRNRSVNKNLFAAFLIMCFITIAVNYNFFLVAMVADKTTRGIYVDRLTEFNFNWGLFKVYLLNGQYHATVYPKRILWPLAATLSFFVAYMIVENKEIMYKEIKSVFILCLGWLLCFIGPLIMTAQESGFRVGLLLIDGFQWGRVIALTTFIWPMMIVAIMYILREKKIFQIIICFAICLQLTYVAQVNSTYNDTWTTIRNEISYHRKGARPYISYNEFASEKIFEEIKKDIGYEWQGVVAYGYHPAVLLLNNFNTIDGYFSVHSMEWQNQFREIIAPALELDEANRTYYDTWGGRMYIFGPLEYAPSKDKNVESTDIYIDVDAYKKYGGKYVLSRAEIANAREQGLEFIDDYDSDESMYHIYLYCVK